MKRIDIIRMIACVITGVVLCLTTPAVAQEPKQDTPPKQSPSEEKSQASRPLPLRRMKIESIDKERKIITLGGKNYAVTTETRITKDGAPFEFEKLEVGMSATGSYRKLDDGSLQLVSLKVATESQEPNSEKQPPSTQ